MADSLEDALDELYATDPSEFVSARKSLAARLRGAGDREAAKVLQAARRPTKAAWILNQLARRHPDIVEALLERGRELRAAQQRAITGRPDELRAATSAQRDALAVARDAAARIAGTDASEVVRTQVGDTLLAASADERLGAQLRQGRLVHESSGGTGFPELGGLRLVPSAGAPPSPAARTSPSRPPREAGRQKETQHVRAAERREAERVRAAELVALRAAQREAREEVSVAEDASRRADARVDRLRDELDTAREDARRARRVLTDARRRQREIDQKVTRSQAARPTAK